MNIVKSLVARIEKRLTETKNPCPLYATEQGAERIANEWVKKGAEYFGVPERDVRYVIVHIPSVNKYAIGFDGSLIFARGDGGYVGFFTNHYTF